MFCCFPCLCQPKFEKLEFYQADKWGFETVKRNSKAIPCCDYSADLTKILRITNHLISLEKEYKVEFIDEVKNLRSQCKRRLKIVEIEEDIHRNSNRLYVLKRGELTVLGANPLFSTYGLALSESIKYKNKIKSLSESRRSHSKQIQEIQQQLLSVNSSCDTDEDERLPDKSSKELASQIYKSQEKMVEISLKLERVKILENLSVKNLEAVTRIIEILSPEINKFISLKECDKEIYFGNQNVENQSLEENSHTYIQLSEI